MPPAHAPAFLLAPLCLVTAIAAMTTESTQARTAMDDTRQKADRSAQRASTADSSLVDIVRSSEGVQAAVQRISQTTSVSSDAIQQTATACEELSKRAEQLRELVAQFSVD